MKRFVKIAYLVNQYPKVSHAFIRREIRELESQGAEVLRFTIRRCPEALAEEADREELAKTMGLLDVGFMVMLCSVLSVLILSLRRFIRALLAAISLGWTSDRGIAVNLAYLVEACVLLRRLTSQNVQRLHAHFGTNAASVAMLCRVLGGPPYSFSVHGPEEFERAPSLALDKKIAGAAFVVAISQFCRRQLYRWCEPTEWAKIHVVRCGLDESFLASRSGAPPRDPALICVGRLCEEKGQALLLEAAAELEREGVRFSLKLVGDGALRTELERSIVQLGLKNRVSITGWASSQDIRQHILNSRALVLPSLAEGLPVVLMEAFSLGRPVITTRIAGIPELVEDGINGWLLPPGSPEALRNAMVEAIASPPERLHKMGLAGREVVVRKHRVSAEVRKLMTLFCQGGGEEKTVGGSMVLGTVTS